MIPADHAVLGAQAVQVVQQQIVECFWNGHHPRDFRFEAIFLLPLK